jgi:hypothetical protein
MLFIGLLWLLPKKYLNIKCETKEVIYMRLGYAYAKMEE